MQGRHLNAISDWNCGHNKARARGPIIKCWFMKTSTPLSASYRTNVARSPQKRNESQRGVILIDDAVKVVKLMPPPPPAVQPQRKPTSSWRSQPTLLHHAKCEITRQFAAHCAWRELCNTGRAHGCCEQSGSSVSRVLEVWRYAIRSCRHSKECMQIWGFPP